MRYARNYTLLDRFLDSIEKDANGCWRWTGFVGPRGYGVMSVLNRSQRAHRVAWELLVGPIPRGLQLDHLCRVRDCTNPDHLELVTPRQNVLRGEGLCAENARKVVCLQGHPLSGKNLWVWRGRRRCRACKRQRLQEWRQREARRIA